MTPEICPNCGAEVPERARACPDCGADEKTGWSDEARYDSLGLPDDSFDYGEYVKREFGGKRHGTVTGIKPVWQAIAVVVVLGVLYWLFHGWF
ncbi:MAG: zinc ribbon domain-containing protein [Verrucomicrobiales bacterium]|nr:zinc ribbon domain-containing protein [Verrucomicrobiales bacterium]